MAFIETESGVERESAVLCCVCGYRSGRKPSEPGTEGCVCNATPACQGCVIFRRVCTADGRSRGSGSIELINEGVF